MLYTCSVPTGPVAKGVVLKTGDLTNGRNVNILGSVPKEHLLFEFPTLVGKKHLSNSKLVERADTRIARARLSERLVVCREPPHNDGDTLQLLYNLPAPLLFNLTEHILNAPPNRYPRSDTAVRPGQGVALVRQTLLIAKTLGPR